MFGERYVSKYLSMQVPWSTNVSWFTNVFCDPQKLNSYSWFVNWHLHKCAMICTQMKILILILGACVCGSKSYLCVDRKRRKRMSQKYVIGRRIAHVYWAIHKCRFNTLHANCKFSNDRPWEMHTRNKYWIEPASGSETYIFLRRLHKWHIIGKLRFLCFHWNNPFQDQVATASTFNVFVRSQI